MQPTQEIVLLYNIQPAERQDALLALLDRLAMPHKIVTPADADQTLGYLLSHQGFSVTAPAPSSGTAPQGEMLILHGLSNLRLDALLKALRTSGIAPVVLKAVVTDTNIQWPLKTLYGHLLLEHMQMRNIHNQQGQA